MLIKTANKVGVFYAFCNVIEKDQNQSIKKADIKSALKMSLSVS